MKASNPKVMIEAYLQGEHGFYEKVFGEQDFLKYFLNSTIVGVAAVGLSLVLTVISTVVLYTWYRKPDGSHMHALQATGWRSHRRHQRRRRSPRRRGIPWAPC